MPNVQERTPDDRQRDCPKHVEFLDKNKFGKISASVGFIIKKCVTMQHGHMNIICVTMHGHINIKCVTMQHGHINIKCVTMQHGHMNIKFIKHSVELVTFVFVDFLKMALRCRNI